jgi:hypothetical protein
MSCSAHRLLVIASLAVVAACEESDVGEKCGTPVGPLDAEIIEGEQPVDEIVRMQRDGACESFQCLTHKGLAPYCTETCTYEGSSSNKTCAGDGDCTKDGESCVDNQCKSDSCDPGFQCRQVQEVGPLADQRFCVRKIGCASNFDCDDLDKMECAQLGCLDSDFLLPSSEDVHFLSCQPRDELPCICNGQTDKNVVCADGELICDPGTGNPWPTSTVAQVGVCVGKEQTAVTPVAPTP